MKKITLAILAAFSSVSMVYSQANISVEAPVHNTNYLDLLPMGADAEATLTAVYLVNSTELSALTGTAITSLGIQLARGTATAVPGTFTVYMQNTSDMTYNKGTSFTAAIVGMTQTYTGNLNIPASQNSSTFTLNFPQTYSYTPGSGIYVALKWQSVGPFVATPGTNNGNLAAWPSNDGTPGTDMGAIEEVSVGNPITDIMTTTEARPSFLFRAANTATNEAGVLYVQAPGKVAKTAASHVIQAYVRNSSINPLTNVTVSLAVGGANTFNNVQTIASINAGAVATVSFAAFNPTVMGVNHVSVTLAADQNLTNNRMVWTQSVTCNIIGNNPPDPQTSFTTGLGFPNGGIFSSPYTLATTSTLTGVRLSISSEPTNAGHKLYGVVMDDQGTILGTTDTLSPANGTFQFFHFNPAQQLNAGSTYFVGLAQDDGGIFPMGFEQNTQIYPNLYYASPVGGGGFNSNSAFGYFGIEPVLGPELIITSSPTGTICKGETISLTADGGASTFTWSAIPNNTSTAISSPTSANISVSPAVTVTYTLKGTDGAGCTNSVTLKQVVSACTGISVTAAKDANIRLFPNPSVNSKCSVSGLEGTNTITVYNMLGETILSKSTTEETVSIDLGSQPEGNYLVRITDTNNYAKTLKFINQR